MPSGAAHGDAVITYPRQVISGPGTLAKLGAAAGEHGRTALLVTHRPGRVRASGVVDVAVEALTAAGVDAHLFEVGQTPEADEIDRGAAALRSGSCDMVIGIGGGSPLDAAKAISLLSANGDRWAAFQMEGQAVRAAGPPIIAVPTTAGSGSDATAVAVITNAEHGIIRSVSHPFMIPRATILDGDLLASAPQQVLAVSGLDAFVHALESGTSLRSNPLTQALSRAALQMVTANLPAVVSGANDPSARQAMSIGSHLAGQGLSAGVGAAHVLAQPISAVLGVNHGTALSMVLVETIRYNEGLPQDPYRTLVPLVAAALGVSSDTSMSELVGSFMDRVGARRHASELGEASAIPSILDAVVRSTGHIWTNPRPLDLDALEGILTRSWETQ